PWRRNMLIRSIYAVIVVALGGIRHSRAKYRSGISLPLFTRSQVCQPDGGVGLALPVQWESAVGGQHRERVWLHAAISGLGKIISALPRQGLRGPRLSGKRFRRPRARLEQANRPILSIKLRCHVPDVRKDVRRRSKRQPALP